VVSTVEILEIGGNQMIKLPADFRFQTARVSIRREGEAVVLEPVKLETWPAGFFEAIHVEDPKFVRPDQGQVPPAPALE
jgi:virulence-associated protein VagC